MLLNFITFTQLAQNTACTTYDLCVLNASSNLGTGNAYWFHSINTVDGDFTIEMTSNKNLAYKLFGPFEIVDQDLCDSLSQSLSDVSIFYTTGQNILSLSDVSPIGSFYILYVSNLVNGNGAIINVNTLNCFPFVLGSIVEKFYGQSKHHSNHIYFETSREFSIDYYTVEHSTDGIFWQALDRVYSTNLEYNSYHVEHLFKDLDNYYRLVSYDIDGSITKSQEIIHIENQKNQQVAKVYNSMGQEVDEFYKGFVIYLFEDGTTVKIAK